MAPLVSMQAALSGMLSRTMEDAQRGYGSGDQSAASKVQQT